MDHQSQSVSYADAPSQNDLTELIPNGTLAFAVLRIRPFNPDQGMIETPSKSSEAHYLDCELTIEGGPYDRRKIWTLIGVAGTEKYINMGRSSIKAILEAAFGAGPQNLVGYNLPATQNAQGQPVVNYMPMDGQRVAIKIKVQKGGENYADKNEIGAWLSPIDPVTAKDWARLLAGDIHPRGARGAAAQPAPAASPPAGAVAPQAAFPGMAPAVAPAPITGAPAVAVAAAAANPATQVAPAPGTPGGGAPSWVGGGQPQPAPVAVAAPMAASPAAGFAEAVAVALSAEAAVPAPTPAEAAPPAHAAPPAGPTT